LNEELEIKHFDPLLGSEDTMRTGPRVMAKRTNCLFGCAIVVTLFCYLTCGAQSKSNNSLTGMLVGQVADQAENAAIPRAIVFLRRQGEKEIVTLALDSNGKFKSRLATGLYDVFVAADGFVPMVKVVSIEPGKTTQYSPRLRPDSEHMQNESDQVRHR
jgi:Carboxypeptidase regulatory-like domain